MSYHLTTTFAVKELCRERERCGSSRLLNMVQQTCYIVAYIAFYPALNIAYKRHMKHMSKSLGFG